MAEVGSLFIPLGHSEHLEVADRYDQNIWITGPGRSKRLHNILTNLPLEINIWLYDCDEDTLNDYGCKEEKNQRVFSGCDAGHCLVDALEFEIGHRLKKLVVLEKNSYFSCCQDKESPPFPRIMIIIDYFDQFLRNLAGTDPSYIKRLENLMQFASVCGITIVVSGERSNLVQLLPQSFFRLFGYSFGN